MPEYRELTPRSAGCTELAVRIAKRLLEMDAFAAVVAACDLAHSDYDSAALAADMARAVDAELHETWPYRDVVPFAMRQSQAQ